MPRSDPSFVQLIPADQERSMPDSWILGPIDLARPPGGDAPVHLRPGSALTKRGLVARADDP